MLLYTSGSSVLGDTWIIGHYTTYHVVLALLLFAMIFGVGLVAWWTYAPTRFIRFVFIALGNFLLWLFLEDEFTFIFSGAAHTQSDWTNWPIGVAQVFGYYVPLWYVVVIVGIFGFWYLGLSMGERQPAQ